MTFDSIMALARQIVPAEHLCADTDELRIQAPGLELRRHEDAPTDEWTYCVAARYDVRTGDWGGQSSGSLDDESELRALLESAADRVATYAEELSDGWSVVDPAGGRWWPTDEEAEEIAASTDPGLIALRLCAAGGGEWHQ